MSIYPYISYFNELMNKSQSIHKIGILNVLAVVFCFSFCLSLFADEASDAIRELEELKKDRDRIRKEQNNVVKKERNTRAELEDIEKQLVAREREIRIYRQNLSTCEKDIKTLRDELKVLEGKYQKTKSLMVKRIRAMYKFGYEGGELSYLKLLLSADNIMEFTSRYKYMSAIIEGDRKLQKQLAAEKSEIESKKEQVEARKQRILYYKASAERIRKEILSRKGIRQSRLSELQKSKEHLTRTLRELEQSVAELENLMARLKHSSKEDIYEDIEDLGKSRGKLPWPVSGRIISNSAPSMQGVTIKARQGASIRCVAGGVVEYAQWFDGVGFGLMVIINHGNGYRTLYAHSSELLVKKGQKVRSGQVIAKVGDTGSLKGPMLYFEIWKGTEAMSTRRWLR
ncbi:peptidoglycan DD-metalloendopeptidase family protein [Candidatus Poribacteria bacterium]|nr:peptidoglycan DD-metalloendopeptidase family protein [Candidatus Poribacteria bacterium]